MKWNKSFLVVLLVGITVFAMVGCGKGEKSGSTMEQTTPSPSSTNGTALLPPGGTRPLPPEGSVSDNMSRPMMDFAAAAAKLGVTEQQLREALGSTSQGPLDFAAAAKQLGVSEQSLREALGFPEGTPPAGNPPSKQAPTVNSK